MSKKEKNKTVSIPCAPMATGFDTVKILAKSVYFV